MSEPAKPILRLSKADGNVFNIIGLARRVLIKEKVNEREVTEFVNKCWDAESYEGVLQLCMERFEVI